MSRLLGRLHLETMCLSVTTLKHSQVSVALASIPGSLSSPNIYNAGPSRRRGVSKVHARLGRDLVRSEMNGVAR